MNNYESIQRPTTSNDDGSFTKTLNVSVHLAQAMSSAFYAACRNDHGGDKRQAALNEAFFFLASVLDVDCRDEQDQTITLAITRK